MPSFSSRNATGVRARNLSAVSPIPTAICGCTLTVALLPRANRRHCTFCTASRTRGTTPQKGAPMAKTENTAIRPFHVNIPDGALVDLRRRIKATKWPERETVKDPSQGVQFATMQKLADYWANHYDWRKIEAKLNALPQFITEINGLDIHFIHVRSKHESRSEEHTSELQSLRHLVCRL